MKELKPCPFCGSEDVELRSGVMFNGAVHCNSCSADVVFDAVRLIQDGDYDWRTAVTNGWNRRASYEQGWHDGREALREEMWENERDRFD